MGILLSAITNNSIAILTKRTLAERLEIAGLNTLIGLGTVFTVLILITLLISLFKYIPNLFQGKKSNTKENNKPVDNIIAQIVEKEEEELNDDLELVAVITAAISTYMDEATSTNGFIVRSIKKVSSKKRINL